MWVRGLKQNNQRKNVAKEHVAPYVGAWIETTSDDWRFVTKYVAPYVGAWIETAMTSCNTSRSVSHPMWVRGLKQHHSVHVPMKI